MPAEALVIVPTYNERDNLVPLAERILRLPGPVDLLVVDDNSPDGTGQIADELAAKHPSIHVLHRQEKNGLGRAYCAGFAWALAQNYEFILEMDGDFSHNPDDIPRFIAAARDADLALGSRYCNGIRVINWPLNRLVLSLGAAQYVRIITGMRISDPTGGYKCFRRHALKSIDLEAVRSNGYSFQVELTHKLWRRGMKIVEVPIIFTDRFQGTSKMSGAIMWEALFMVWRLLAQNGFRRSPRKSVSGARSAWSAGGPPATIPNARGHSSFSNAPLPAHAAATEDDRAPTAPENPRARSARESESGRDSESAP